MSGGGRYGLGEHGMAMSEADVAGVAVDTRHWIGGRRVASPGTFTDLSPIDGQPLAEVARGGEAEVAAAVQAAREAFGGGRGPRHRTGPPSCTRSPTALSGGSRICRRWRPATTERCCAPTAAA